MAPTGYPKVPAKAWSTLRGRVVTAPSTKLTPTAVAALLGMGSAKSASDNVVSPLRRLGLIDEDGALTDRGNKWRVDATYAEACQEILDALYPSELSALTDDAGRPDKARVRTWMQHRGFGGSNANQMAATYVMIAEKTVPEASTSETSRPQPRRREAKRAPTKATRPAAVAPTKRVETHEAETGGAAVQPRTGPDVHLDIQIHIPADATPEQIDQIFASMAKHLYQP